MHGVGKSRGVRACCQDASIPVPRACPVWERGDYCAHAATMLTFPFEEHAHCTALLPCRCFWDFAQCAACCTKTTRNVSHDIRMKTTKSNKQNASDLGALSHFEPCSQAMQAASGKADPSSNPTELHFTPKQTSQARRKVRLVQQGLLIKKTSSFDMDSFTGCLPVS